jgi:hypothetical protein
MSVGKVFSPRMVHVALIACAGLLIAPSATANAQSQKDYSSSRDNSLYSNEEVAGSSLATEHKDRNNGYDGGYVSHDWWSHLTFEGGGGFTIPTGSARQYENKGWNIKAGGGYNLKALGDPPALPGWQ